MSTQLPSHFVVPSTGELIPILPLDEETVAATIAVTHAIEETLGLVCHCGAPKSRSYSMCPDCWHAYKETRPRRLSYAERRAIGAADAAARDAAFTIESDDATSVRERDHWRHDERGVEERERASEHTGTIGETDGRRVRDLPTGGWQRVPSAAFDLDDPEADREATRLYIARHEREIARLTRLAQRQYAEASKGASEGAWAAMKETYARRRQLIERVRALYDDARADFEHDRDERDAARPNGPEFYIEGEVRVQLNSERNGVAEWRYPSDDERALLQTCELRFDVYRMYGGEMFRAMFEHPRDRRLSERGYFRTLNQLAQAWEDGDVTILQSAIAALAERPDGKMLREVTAATARTTDRTGQPPLAQPRVATWLPSA